MPAPHFAAQIQALAGPLLIQHPANVPKKSVEDGPSVWVPSTHLADQDGVPSSWLLP